MPKRKAYQLEIDEGIGEPEVDDEGYDVEDTDDEKIVCLASDEENDMDDELLIAGYHEAKKQAEKEGD